jgi:ribosomal protein S18 acetylase RimI-like enzyme
MIKSRIYNNDYNKIIEFLRDMYRQNGNQYCWLPQKWEYAEFNVNPLYISRGWDDWNKYTRIWEENNKIVAIAHKECAFDVFLEIRPGYENLAAEMLDHLENVVPTINKDQNKELTVFAADSKSWLCDILVKRNYTKSSECCFENYYLLTDNFIPTLPEGYHIVDGTDIKNQQDRFKCCHLGFCPNDEPDNIPKLDFTMENAPLFNPKLEIMTQNDEGELCSFCVIWFDPEINIGMVEPVCTRDHFRRKGLGKQMLIEGLRRLKDMGAKIAYVESYGDNRRAFYNSIGFITYEKDYPWTKKF